MLASLMMNVKQRLASHLEVRDIRIMLNSQLERTDKTLAIMEKYKGFLTNPKNAHSKALYNHIAKESRIRDRDVYNRLVSGLKETESRLKSLIDLYDNNTHRVLISSSLTTINLNALHLAAICDFYEKMCRSLTLGVSEFESVQYHGIEAPKSLYRYMSTNFNAKRISSLGSIISYNDKVKRKDIVKVIREMDDVEVTEETLQAAQAMGGNTRIDPAGFNYLNVINPKFWAYVGIKSYSELRLLYLDMEQDELELLEIRHQELAQLKERGDTSVATDKLITDIKDRIDIKRYEIKELEESLG